MGPSSKQKKILLYHKIGSGKTCTAIQIGEAWKKTRHIIVVVPAFLVQNFYNELKSACGEYKTDSEIHKHYSIYSYHGFIGSLSRISLQNAVLIVDEVHNMVSDTGVFYSALAKKLARAPDDLRVVLMSATPIFDHPSEIALTLNLLLKPEDHLPTQRAFEELFIDEDQETGNLHMKNADILRSKVSGLISFYSGMPARAYPRLEFNTVKCTMSDFQHQSYLTSLRKKQASILGRGILRLPLSFFLGARMTSNVAFPNRKANNAGFKSWEGKFIRGELLKKYSIKFYKILKRIQSAPRGTKIFIYSSFVEYGGVKSLVAVLEENGYLNWKNKQEDDKGRWFAIWTGHETTKYKEEIRKTFNQRASGLDIIIGSPSIREGVTLLRVQQVHILEPYWNFSRIIQVLGRAYRFCTHQDLPPHQRVVRVYLYLAIRPDEAKYKNDEDLTDRYSIDRYIAKIAIIKKDLNSEFEKVLQQESVDCRLNQPLTRIRSCS